MHVPPSNEEKYLYVNQNKFFVYLFGVSSTALIIVGNLLFVYFNPFFSAYLIFVLLTGFYLILSYVIGIMGKPFDFKRHKLITAKWLDRACDAKIDIYLPVCNEPISLIKNTWSYVLKLKAAHPQLKIYVLDDGRSDELEELAQKCRFHYHRRKDNLLKKAGNIRSLFPKTDGEFIIILDADFCPRSDFILETLPYFFENEEIAIVQTPQFFRIEDHKSWVGKGTSGVQEYFYRLAQPMRNTFGGAICVGTSACYRRKALDPIGGPYPIEYSEDVHTGFELISNFWKIEYIPINVSAGVCPDDMKSFFVQQYRWSLGSVSLFFSKRFWKSPITIMQRVCYLNGCFYYLSTGVGVLFSFLPGLLLLIFLPEKVYWFNLLFSVPSLIYTTVFMAWWMKLKFGFYIPQSRQVACFSHFFAIRDFLFNSLEGWIATGDKNVKSNRYEQFKKWFYVLCVGPQVLLFGLIAIRISQGYDPLNFSLMILFGLYNAFITVPILRDL